MLNTEEHKISGQIWKDVKFQESLKYELAKQFSDSYQAEHKPQIFLVRIFARIRDAFLVLIGKADIYDPYDD